MRQLIQIIKETYAYRELLLALVSRNIRVTYKQAAFGVMWVFFMPVMAITSGVMFRAVMSLFSDRPLLLSDVLAVMVKTVPWLIFSSIVGGSSGSLVSSMGLITKIYFPRQIVPFSQILTSLFNFSISLTGLILALTAISFFSSESVSPVVLSFQLLWVPLFLLTLILMATGIGLILSCANLFYRDVKYIVGVIMQFGIMFSLVYFTYTELGQWGWYFLLNPVTPVLESIRMVVIEGAIDPFMWPWLAYSITAATVVLVAGSIVFKRAESSFAEFI